MFSLNRFYNILHDNLISKIHNGKSVCFYPFGTYENNFILTTKHFGYNIDSHVEYFNWRTDRPFFHCYFADQEPYYNETFPVLKNALIHRDHIMPDTRINILANSEKSQLKNNFLQSENYYDGYYFYHGFAALDWYRDFQYIEPQSFKSFDKVFICYNHLISKYRSYRLHLVSNLIEQDLVKHGRVSMSLEDNLGTWEETVRHPETPLDTRARLKIYKVLQNVKKPLVIDTDTPNGTLSANVDFDDLVSALFHVVTETVYFQDKLHLTEKVFKPIVAKRPFFLVSTPGSLAYFKSYGFKSFDRWIDESYDDEEDHYIRIEKITEQIKQLCSLPMEELKEMHIEMQEVLEYNFNHFYNTFKDIIVDELVDNFSGVLGQINNGRQPNNHSKYHQRFELLPEYLADVKTRLKQ